MSNSLAIAAVTSTLRNRFDRGLDSHLPGTSVTTQPPDAARDGNGNQLNLFLYQTELAPAWRNADMPQQTNPGETAQSPLGLNLYYLLTAYGQDNDDVLGHRLLGRAMSTLHDHPVLGREEIRNALEGNDLGEQIERVCVTPQPLSLDEMSKLWSTFQTQYRISAAYQASVILIESTRPARAPLPVLKRAEGDTGISAQPDLTAPYPALLGVDQPSLELGESLTIRGLRLSEEPLALRFAQHPLEERFTVTEGIDVHTDTAIAVRFADPSEPELGVAAWPGPAGFYTVTAILGEGDKQRETNAVPFSLAPKITGIEAARDDQGVSITVVCSPSVWRTQSVSLLLGADEVRATPRKQPEPQNRLTFPVRNVPTEPGTDYWVRLRVNGVDSLLVDRSGTQPVFKESQKVTIP